MARVITRGVRRQPAFGGGDLAILLGVSVLRRDELRPQRHHLRVAGTDDDRRDGTVKMRGPAVRVPETGTLRAMNVFGLRGEIPRRISCDEPGVLDGPHGRPQTLLSKGFMQIIEPLHQRFRRNRVERLAKVIIRGAGLDLEKRAGINAGAGQFHVPLETQERGALGEEHRERRQRDVGHGVLGVGAVRGSGSAPAGDEVIETGLLHALLDAGPGQKYQ